MSRVAKKPINLPPGVQVNISTDGVSVKGPKGELSFVPNPLVQVKQQDGALTTSVNSSDPESWAQAGTARAILNNLVIGVTQGFEKKLELVGVGYRAQVQGKTLNLTLGFSHPVDIPVPDGINIETPSQTEVVISGIDKQMVGQVAADIRAWRPPEPYKGKGIKYANEHIVRKEAKKK
ncbi:MAG: 50S ribosomal protein L6 [Gammaproteobacteria bacterium]|nr:MAG: 50S ribosomal protein L6 [Gammaproteobacteria bacterium]